VTRVATIVHCASNSARLRPCGLGLPRDEHLALGRSLVCPLTPMEMSVPGVFAVGDVRHASVKRVAPAVGEGSVSIPLIHAGLNDWYPY